MIYDHTVNYSCGYTGPQSKEDVYEPNTEEQLTLLSSESTYMTIHPMGAGVVKPDQHGFRIHIHAGNRSNHRMDQSNSDSKCEECSSKLSRRTISCKDCERLFCLLCSVQAVQQCKKCHILLSGNFSRPQLREWKPKDLKALLHKHDVNTSKCREKDELIDLIFTYFGSNPNRTRNETQHNRNIDDLTNNMRQENVSEQSSQQNTSQRSPDNNNGTQSTGLNNGTRSTGVNNGTQSTGVNNGTQSTGVNNGTQSTGVNEPTQQSQNQSNQDSENGNQTGTNDTEEINTARNEISHIKLEDIKSEEHIEQLSIKCLKRLLLNNFVDYKGCCERWELQERVKRLWNDDQKNKEKVEVQRKVSENPSVATNDGSSSNEDDICKICMDAAIDCVLLECGHMVTCTNCGKRLSECPICRQYVVRAVHIFKA